MQTETCEFLQLKLAHHGIILDVGDDDLPVPVNGGGRDRLFELDVDFPNRKVRGHLVDGSGKCGFEFPAKIFTHD